MTTAQSGMLEDGEFDVGVHILKVARCRLLYDFVHHVEGAR